MMLKTTLLSIRTPHSSAARPHPKPRYRARTRLNSPRLAVAVALVNAGGHKGGGGHAHGDDADEDGFPACYSGPACAGIAHGCYDCSILKESDCDGHFNAHLTDLSSCAEGSEPKVAACYRGPACTAAGASHGCYDCSVTQASQCDSSFNDALAISSCLEGTAPTKPAATISPPEPPPAPPSPPPPQRMTDCKPGEGIKCSRNEACGGALLAKPKDPPNPKLEPCYHHSQCMTLDGQVGMGVCCVPIGTCDHLNPEGRPYVSAYQKYYVGGCQPYAHHGASPFITAPTISCPPPPPSPPPTLTPSSGTSTGIPPSTRTTRRSTRRPRSATGGRPKTSSTRTASSTTRRASTRR